LQTINYGYHLRGMLNCVNCENGNPVLSPMDNDLFAYKLDFEDAGQFSGNIGKQNWRSKISENIKRYDYSYDAAKRLISSVYNGNNDYSTPLINYDLNGNVTNLHRNGINDSLSAIDRLEYTYQGNKLLSVTDTITGNTNVGDFRDGNISGNDYDYYSNGNLKSDLNQDITSIIYDTYLNQPTQINLSDSRWIKKYYSGEGSLLKRESSLGDVWQYGGSIIYRNDTLYQITTPEGRALLDTNNNWNYEFEYRDHLGSLRMSFKDTTSGSPSIRKAALISQTADYYAFGMPHSTSFIDSVGKQNFGFSNYEKEEELDLVNINFGQRVYNPTIGRFDKIDRFSDKYYFLSSFSYAANNPIRFIDINGDSILIQHQKENILYEDGKLFWAGSGMKEYDGKALNKKGNLKGFVGQTVKALDKIANGGKTGSQLIQDLQSFDSYVSVRQGDNQTRGIRVTWNPKTSDGGLDQKGNTSRPSFVGLAHELAHAHDYTSDGSAADNTSWYIYPNKKIVFFAEVYASHIENQIRRENNLSLRQYYSQDKIEKMRLIDSQGNSLWFLNNNFNY